MRILKYPNFLTWIRPIYDKSLWFKAKHIAKILKEEEPSAAHYLAIAPVIMTIVLVGLVIQGKYFANLTPKYYPYINIYRSDDPNISSIRKDECLLIGTRVNKFSLHKHRIVE